MPYKVEVAGDDPVIGTREAGRMVGLQGPGVVAAMKRGDFPKPAVIRNRRYYWRKSAVVAFLCDAEAATAGALEAQRAGLTALPQ